jgi:small nuclear ribonucleoprotein (snRNP)-like protein
MSVDSYMNVQLGNVEEWIDGAMAGKLGDEVLIRYVAVTEIPHARALCAVLV